MTEKSSRLEDVVKEIYGEQIEFYARGFEPMERAAVEVCIPAVAALTLPEQYASIVLTSRMDNELRKLLERMLHRQGNAEELLFDYDRPLSSFSAKINSSFSFGLLTKKMYDALTCCRKIRNAFAHADNPDQAMQSAEYARHKARLMSLDAEYAAECIRKFRSLRERYGGSEGLPGFSEISGVMIGISETLGSAAFAASVARSAKMRFPCAFFGFGDAPLDPGSFER